MLRERGLSDVALSIIIPTYNNLRLLQRCLTSVERHRPASSEVIVVDDASTDGTPEVVAREWPGVHLISRRPNGGFCRSANDGLRAASGTIVELLNNDTEVAEGWADAALAAFEDPSIGSVAPLVRRLPFRQRIDSAGDRFFPIGIARKRWEGRAWIAGAARAEDVFSASASSAFYRREAIERVGRFPEEFDSYLDDVDLGFRLHLAGYRCLYLPTSIVFHWVSQTHRVTSRRIGHQVARNSESLFWSNLPARQLALLGVPHLAFVLCLLAYKGLKGEFGSCFSGKCEALAKTSAILARRRFAQSLANST